MIDANFLSQALNSARRRRSVPPAASVVRRSSPTRMTSKLADRREENWVHGVYDMLMNFLVIAEIKIHFWLFI
jgi:hypothetical protein